MVSERQKAILFAVIDEHIKGAEPISSHMVCETFDFGVSPATMRNEFAKLEEEGYLYQPHTSAGRVPTDKGYRLFVNALLADRANNNRKMREAFQRITDVQQEAYAVFSEFAKIAASFSGNTAFSGSLGTHAFFKSGMHEALRQPELADSLFRERFGDAVDSFDENLGSFFDTLDRNDVSVFIGKENPIAKAKDFSMLVSRFRTSSNEGIVVIFGPKRMDYRKGLDVLNALHNLLE